MVQFFSSFFEAIYVTEFLGKSLLTNGIRIYMETLKKYRFWEKQHLFVDHKL